MGGVGSGKDHEALNGTFIFNSVDSQLNANRISIIVNVRGLVNFTLEQLYQSLRIFTNEHE